MTPAQNALLKTAITADPTLAQAVSVQDWPAVADALNTLATPAFTVWRTNVTRAEIYHQPSDEATTWSWSVFKAQSVPEQNSWVQMFMGDQANFSLPNLRNGIEVIFGANAAQTVHCKAIGKRSAKLGEKILATGVGSLASPATMGFEGQITAADIQQAMK